MRTIRLNVRYPQTISMLNELSEYGRTISKFPAATRELSIKLKPLKELKLIYFSQTFINGSKTTIVTVKPGKKLEFKDNRVKLITV